MCSKFLSFDGNGLNVNIIAFKLAGEAFVNFYKL